MRIASRRDGSSPIDARRLHVSRKLSPASTSSRVRSVATKVEFPELPLASAQILTIKAPRIYSCNKDRPKQQGPILFAAEFLFQRRCPLSYTVSLIGTLIVH